jgi:RNA polymerase primary sigma factor
MRQLKISKRITVRETESLDRYLSDIAKEELISADDEVQLAQRIKTGDQAALEKLCKANLRFVVSVAKQYQNQGLPLPDLINDGNIGLVKAARRYDETRGFKFISYAVWWIRQSILSALAEQSRIVRLPLNQVSSLSKMLKTNTKLEQKFERTPLVSELASELEISEEKVAETLRISTRIVSMDAPIDENEEVHVIDTFESGEPPTDDAMIQESLSKEVHRSLAKLSRKEREFLELFYGIGHTRSYTIEEIAVMYGIFAQTVRQIKTRALRRLKYNGLSKLLKSYLG